MARYASANILIQLTTGRRETRLLRRKALLADTKNRLSGWTSWDA
jgi:hypothetical protein